MRREVRNALERRRERQILEEMVWYTLPWYRKVAWALVGRGPD